MEEVAVNRLLEVCFRELYYILASYFHFFCLPGHHGPSCSTIPFWPCGTELFQWPKYYQWSSSELDVCKSVPLIERTEIRASQITEVVRYMFGWNLQLAPFPPHTHTHKPCPLRESLNNCTMERHQKSQFYILGYYYNFLPCCCQ